MTGDARTLLMRLARRDKTLVGGPETAEDGNIAVFDGAGRIKDGGVAAGTLWHAGNDGAGSDLDAGLLCGLMSYMGTAGASASSNFQIISEAPLPPGVYLVIVATRTSGSTPQAAGMFLVTTTQSSMAGSITTIMTPHKFSAASMVDNTRFSVSFSTGSLLYARMTIWRIAFGA